MLGKKKKEPFQSLRAFIMQTQDRDEADEAGILIFRLSHPFLLHQAQRMIEESHRRLSFSILPLLYRLLA